MTFTTRFAPSPTGPLHLGHAFSALLAHDLAIANTGRFLLRIEDIDQTRCRPRWEAQIYEDLEWLGIRWDPTVMRQSNRMSAYTAALDELWSRGFLYPCTCKRRDILEASQAPQEGVQVTGPDGVIYPGTCRPSAEWHPSSQRPTDTALRLNLHRLAPMFEGDVFHFTNRATPLETSGLRHEFTLQRLIEQVGDVVLARKDFGTSYHLAVVVDDAAQNVTDVVRGEDLFDATTIHVLLQRVLGLHTPHYLHHRLIRDETGKRLAKRDDARAIATYRQDGATPQDIRRLVELPDI